MSAKIQDITTSKQEKNLDPRLLQGPLAERGCTDFICIILMVSAIIVEAIFAIEGYAQGKPERLVAAYDSDGKACGLDVVGYDYIYFPILYTNYFNRTTCVKSCPQNSSSILECSPNSIVTSCVKNCGNFNFDNSTTASDYLNAIQNAFDISKFVCIYQTDVFLSRACYPSEALGYLSMTDSFTSAIDLNRYSNWIYDLNTAKYIILAAFFVAFFAGLIYMVVLRYLGGLFVWLTVLLYFVALCVLCAYTYSQYDYYLNGAGYQATSSTSGTNTYDTTQALKILFIVEVVFLGLSVLIFFCIFNKIRLAIGIIKTATVYIGDNFSILLVPPIIGLGIGILWVWWIVSCIYIVGQATITGQTYPNVTTPFATVTFDDTLKGKLLYFMLLGLWNNAFLLALNQFIIGCSVCIWYFSQGPGMESGGSIRKSIYWAFRYHLGSLAFGSLILAIVQFIRIILEYIKYQTAKLSGDNRMTQCLLSCLSCIVACFERFIEFLNRNAYIQIALTGKSFCPAAKDAFETIWSNATRYTLVSGMGAIFTFVGKLFISVSTTLFAYQIFINVYTYKTSLSSPVLPSIVVFFIAYFIGVLFLSVYQMACDAVLTCFIYDEDLNKQNGGQSAQHCPETLREWFDAKDK